MQKRCTLFENISVYVWEEIKRHRRTKTEPQEIGFTSTIISKIRDEFNNDPLVGVWANQSFREDLYGGDIDVFVETEKNGFTWYSLQAKALKVSGRYEAMCHKGDFQWIKLRKLQEQTGCLSFFLLYNGHENFTYSGIDNCGLNFDEFQFGCSIVSLENIIIKSLDKNGNCHSPHFNDFHPLLANPWRILSCCAPKFETKKYSLDQIKLYTEPYKNLKEHEPLGFKEAEIFYNYDGMGSNRIINATKELNHNPSHVLLFRNDFGLL